MEKNQPCIGKHYRIEFGKGYGIARWCVVSHTGEEMAGGLLYEEARRIFDTCEENFGRKIRRPSASMNPAVIELEDEWRKEKHGHYTARARYVS
jgi:hypothetical protein